MIPFFVEFLRNRRLTGAVAPSSPTLARAICRETRIGEARRVLELGPGTGALTREILRQKSPDAHYVGIEINPVFHRELERRHPEAEFVLGCAGSHDFGSTGERFDAVISGLPWMSFPKELQEHILENISTVVEQGGVFATFAYAGPHWLPAGTEFRSRLQECSQELRVTPVTWLNLPPALVYVARF